MSKRLRRRTKRRLKLAGLALGGVVAVGLAVGVASAAITPEPAPVPSSVQDYYDKSMAKEAAAKEPVKDLSFAVAGDSVTEADSPDVAGGMVGAGSWINYTTGDGVAYAGGWADGGAQSERIAANVKPVEADVLVVLAGTNDYSHAVPFEKSAANISAIVKKVGARRVLVSAVPPSNIFPAEAAAYNTELKAFVTSKGWKWVDSSAKLRTNDNAYVEGMTKDGTHPSTEAARIIGQTIRAALLAK